MENRRKDIHSSQRNSKKSSKSSHRNNNGPNTTRPVNAQHRIICERRSRKSRCCYNTERCKGIGAVLIALGVLASIAGIILTVVAANDDDKDSKYPASFLAVGPILLVSAVICFITGTCLYNSYVTDAVRRYFSLDEPTSLCRVHCKKLSQCLRPDETIEINRVAMKALQTEPGKSVLKRGKLPSVASEDNGSIEYSIAAGTLGESDGQKHHLTKGVRFSDSDIEEDHTNHNKNHHHSDSGSILSLRHCKIVPNNEPERIWWTDEVAIQESVFEPNGMTEL